MIVITNFFTSTLYLTFSQFNSLHFTLNFIIHSALTFLTWGTGLPALVSTLDLLCLVSIRQEAEVRFASGVDKGSHWPHLLRVPTGDTFYNCWYVLTHCWNGVGPIRYCSPLQCIEKLDTLRKKCRVMGRYGNQ